MLLEAMDREVAGYSVDNFYYLSRASLVKDERNLDKFDRVFGEVFKGIEALDAAVEADNSRGMAPEACRKAAHRGGKSQHRGPRRLGKDHGDPKRALARTAPAPSGGSKWIAPPAPRPSAPTVTTPRACASAQDENRNHRAIKVWDKREFKNLDDDVKLGTRNIKVALRRLRRFAREGAPDELDLPAPSAPPPTTGIWTSIWFQSAAT